MKKFTLLFSLFAFMCLISYSQIKILESSMSHVNPIDSLTGTKFKNIPFKKGDYFIIKFDSLVDNTDIFVKFWEGQQCIDYGLMFEFYSNDSYSKNKTSYFFDTSTVEAGKFSICKIYSPIDYWVINLDFININYYAQECTNTIIVKETVNIIDTVFFNNCNNQELLIDESLPVTFNNNYLYVPEYIDVVKIYNLQGVFIGSYNSGNHYISESTGIYIITDDNFVKKIFVK